MTMTNILQSLNSVTDATSITGSKSSNNNDMNGLHLSSSSTVSSNDNSTSNELSNASSSSFNNIPPIYIFLDFSSNYGNNLNKIEFTKASYMLVNSADFAKIERKEFNFINIENREFDSKNEFDEKLDSFPTFIQSLTDSIYTHSISVEKPFVFVVSNGWDLKMKFIKYSKDIGEQLPNYFEYPTYFDLRKEFIKYEEMNQLIEFNSISYKQATVGFMKEKLEIKEKCENEKLLDSLYYIAKKLIESDKYSKIFKQPHDMNLDLSQFFIEKSRVVYLTNLSNETTQSELESCFTQFNGRTVTFWLIRVPIAVTENVESSPKTVSGFALFSTHEDAIECLSMNGLLLNDRLIEIQPSSVNVLDKAQELLAPFPSSKNRTRPGDWNCPSCGFSNFQRRIACFRCSFPAASAAAIQESIHNGNTSNTSFATVTSGGKMAPNITNGHNNNNLYKHQNNNAMNSMNSTNGSNQYGNYNNYNSNYNNNYNSNYNNVNNNYSNVNSNYNNMNNKNSDTGGFYNGNNSNNNNNHNNNISNGNNSGYSSRQSSNVPFRAGDWKCINETCSYHNFAKNVCCLKCGAPRVQSAIINGHPHNQHHNHNNNNNSGNSSNDVHYGHLNSSKNNRNNHLTDNYSSRSNSLPNHTNLQFNNGNGNVNNTNINGNINTYSNQQANYNKFISNDMYNLNTVPTTPTSARTNFSTNSNTAGYSSSNLNNMTSSQILNQDFDLTNRIGGLSIDNTGTSNNGSINGINNMFNVNVPNLNMNSINNLNNNLNSSLNSINNTFGGINNMTIPLNMNNGLDMNLNMNMNLNNRNNSLNSKQMGGLNNFGLSGLNGLNGFGLNDLSRTLSSPIMSSPIIGGTGVNNAIPGFSSVDNTLKNNDGGNDKSNIIGGET